MSEYQDFVHDFPRRCRDVLQAFSPKAATADREVTLLLMATAAGFVMPLERLGVGEAVLQPTLDRPRFAREMEQLKAELERVTVESPLFRGTAWRGGALKSAEGTPDQWPELQNPQLLAPDTTVGGVVRQLRNGLAHGNVFSRPNASRQIAALVFVSGGTLRRGGRAIPLKYLILSPRELRTFLSRWFALVAHLRLPQRLVQQTIGEAAYSRTHS